MNKAHLVSELAERMDIPQTASAEAVEHILDIIVRSVVEGEAVTIMGFGTFEARDRAPRTARNPHTGQPVPVPATRVSAAWCCSGCCCDWWSRCWSVCWSTCCVVIVLSLLWT